MPDLASRPPRLPLLLGLAGLLPMVAAVIALVLPGWHFLAQVAGTLYAALILSFLGGLWWGLAGAAPRPPAWLWIASVVPSLIAFAAVTVAMMGIRLNMPAVIGVAIWLTLLVDWRITRDNLAPAWWFGLRLPLSGGLGLLAIAMALLD
jgi:hypothetical protein